MRKNPPQEKTQNSQIAEYLYYIQNYNAFGPECPSRKPTLNLYSITVAVQFSHQYVTAAQPQASYGAP